MDSVLSADDLLTDLVCAKDPPEGVDGWGEAAARWHTDKCLECGAGHAQYMVPPSAGAVAHGQWCDTCAVKHPGAVFIKKVDVLKHLVEQHSSRAMKMTLRKHEARAHHKRVAMQFPVYPLLWCTIAPGAREALRSGGKQAHLLAGAPHRQAALRMRAHPARPRVHAPPADPLSLRDRRAQQQEEGAAKRGAGRVRAEAHAGAGSPN
jgi:hypothetical protein